VYNTRCENNNKVYIGQSINPYKWCKQHMRRPPEKMKHDFDMSKTINLTFKFVILYSNIHKYEVDRMENHYIQYFDDTSSTCYNNLKGKPTSYKKYWYLKRNNMICKCWSHMLWFSNHRRKSLAFIASFALFFIGASTNQMSNTYGSNHSCTPSMFKSLVIDMCSCPPHNDY
jgi:hypothetical protein